MTRLRPPTGSKELSTPTLALLAAAVFLTVVTAGLFGSDMIATARARLAALPPLPAAAPYYRNCADAHSDGVYSIRRGEPGYREALDADGDGRACEPLRGD